MKIKYAIKIFKCAKKSVNYMLVNISKVIKSSASNLVQKDAQLILISTNVNSVMPSFRNRLHVVINLIKILLRVN